MQAGWFDRFAARSKMRSVCAVLLATILVASGVPTSCASGQFILGGAPYDGYYKVFNLVHDGEFADALKAFRDGSSLGIRTSDGRWIDAVCYNVMVGECAYFLGDIATALDQYNVAVRIFLDQPGWMQRVQFPNAVVAVEPNQRTVVPWAPGNRPTLPGAVPDSMQILLGNLDNSDVARRGGVLAAPEYRALNVGEVCRCLTLALRRRAEILGPLCPYDPLSSELVAVYESGVGPSNHWSEAWWLAQYGMALSGLGRHGDAAGVLERSTLVSGSLTHRLSGLAYAELGRLTAREEQYERAEQYYLQASVAAAEFGQFPLVEETLQEATAMRIARNQPAVLPELVIATQWAQRERLRHLTASLMVTSAEHLLVLRQTDAAIAILAEARKVRGRRNTISAQLSARMDHQTAIASFDSGKGPPGIAAAASALQTQQTTSAWLFRIGLMNKWYLSQPGGAVSRNAADLFAELLREPTADDWTRNTLETLAVRMVPNQAAYEFWFEISLERGEFEKALEIAEMLRRHRFQAKLPLGGRLLSLRWVLEAPEVGLDEEARRRRIDLRDRYPEYTNASLEARGAKSLWSSLNLAPPPEKDVEGRKEWRRKIDASVERLRRATEVQEIVLGKIALRREPAPFAFSPHTPLAKTQERLGDRAMVLDFVVTSRGSHAFAISKDGLYHWPLNAERMVRRNILALLKALGMAGDNSTLDQKTLSSEEWKGMAEQVMSDLVQAGQQGAWAKFKELVIVPDGILWYVPFEILRYKDSQGTITRTLGEEIPIRYAPTLALATQAFPEEVKDPRTWVAAGKLHPKDPDTLFDDQWEEFAEVIPGIQRIPDKLSGPSGVERVLWDRLLVLDDLADSQDSPLGWSPARVDAGRPESDLLRWMSLPWGAPRQVLLPGFHSAATHATKGLGDGQEVGDTLMGLMASGVRTVVLARWRTGGQTSYDLMREYLQEVDTMTPAEAWRRSVEVVRSSQLDPALEPRIAVDKRQTSIPANHPFFWAGYLLADAGHETVEVTPKK